MYFISPSAAVLSDKLWPSPAHSKVIYFIEEKHELIFLILDKYYFVDQ